MTLYGVVVGLNTGHSISRRRSLVIGKSRVCLFVCVFVCLCVAVLFPFISSVYFRCCYSCGCCLVLIN